MSLESRVVAELDEVIRAFEQASQGRTPDASFRTRLAAAVERLAPPGSAYIRQVKQHENDIESKASYELSQAAKALRDDYAAGYVHTVAELLHAEVFADFLDMASELQEKGYNDPAAVLAGSTLEEHLRKLAGVHGINAETPDGKPRRADTLNAELARVEAYNKLVQKSITAWLDLRNKAAHGEYDQYDAAQVANLIRDVRDFLSRHPA